MKKIVVLTGAGVSQESGIQTFRDSSESLWNNYKIEDVATIDAWRKNRELVLDFYNQRRSQLKEVEPNEAHFSISRLHLLNFLSFIARFGLLHVGCFLALYCL